ncbi:5-bromo-4-chloroindolyl phosphate hydrolysis family protein [Rhodobaculum claviforme]|uniref:5-bromo-4-chloroindolyl phosphate hydrolysis protein n=1 Tax=Rhodobaculum claviforme TaxID=1549854 RepID=A0A934WIR6_9RHOB|nr:5-bromo-4-chloroindolyl phosphate hydrolysis family protein [Rhodobaculum claviforme]MBK5927137.1 hypothetical protein [Rhodobaculum claviforme]
MARRVTGPFSPQPGRAGTPPPAPRPGIATTFLFLAPLPLALRAIGPDPVAMAQKLGALALLLLAAWLTREGVIAHKAYLARPVARRPAIPRKIFGAGVTGLGLTLAALGPGHDLAQAAIYGLAGAALHLAAFGPDPLANKGMDGDAGLHSERAARAIAEGERHLAAMQAAITAAQDRRLNEVVAGFADQARALFRRVEADPRDLSGARRYLGVYLEGARDATQKFAPLYAQTRDDRLRSEYLALLADLEANFAARATRMLANDQTDFDIETEVLRDRLRREGLAASRRTDQSSGALPRKGSP